MKIKSNSLYFIAPGIHNEKPDETTSLEFDNIMRPFVHRLIDLMLEDRRKRRLNFVIKGNTMFIGQKKYRIKILG